MLAACIVEFAGGVELCRLNCVTVYELMLVLT